MDLFNDHITFLHPTRRRSRRTATLPLAKFLGVLSLLLLFVTTVSAHALLVRSEPENGENLDKPLGQVKAWFSEELDSSLSSMRVFDAQDIQVDNGDGGVDLEDLDHLSMVVTLPPALAEGTYTVRWTAASAEDGDATEGVFAFGVGSGVNLEEPPSQPENSTPVWLFSGAAIVLVFIVLAFIRFRGRQRPSQ